MTSNAAPKTIINPPSTIEINGKRTTAAAAPVISKTKNSRRQPNQVESTNVLDSKRHVKKSQQQLEDSGSKKKVVRPVVKPTREEILNTEEDERYFIEERTKKQLNFHPV